MILSRLIFLLLSLSNFTLLDVHGQILSVVNDHGSNTTKFQTYIVHVQKPKGTKFLNLRERRNWYMSFLPNSTLDSGESRMIYTYSHAISGFSAVLTQEELEAMEAKEGFLLAYPDQECKLRTTHSPEFLGLSQWGGMWPDSGYGQGQIIGMIDSGIKYSHPSFDDTGMSPPPTKWNGNCYWSKNGCNNKLIGALGFHSGQLVSPLDTKGHGTHTASTAAGNFVADADVLGNAKGTASGLAPRAHLAVYKVLPGTNQDAIKGIDQAIRDHVDVLSMSLGSVPLPFYNDPIAIASFAAVTKGIVPCQAGGNDGPLPNMVDGAPWIITVGSSTTDRRIRAIVKLGDGREFYGESAYHPVNFIPTQLPLVYPYGILKTDDAKLCQGNSLSSLNIKGKIVLCGAGSIYSINIEIGELVKKAGGAAVIIMSQPWQGNRTDADPHVLPASRVTFNDAMSILNYLNASPNPTAAITFHGTQFGGRPAPTVSSFSNRGPNLLNGNIIKPDIVAPGSNILGAWTTEVGPNPTGTTKTFITVSGTSMAAPHVSGIAALLRHNHPGWSAAAIKSAIMTTAYTQDRDGNPIKDEYDGQNAGVFVIGSGHVDPIAANEPGLIYDIEPHDYIRYLCGMKLSDNEVTAIVRGPIRCSQIQPIEAEQLNYPSISLYLGPNSMTKTITRTVTNVGDANSVYSLSFDNPNGVNVDVYPDRLQFSQRSEKQDFSVTLSIQGIPLKAGEISEGQLLWDSGKYLVRSPIAVTFA